MKKGQAAMEFLMTYGWAILVVLAAIGALAYFGVLNPAKVLPEMCVGPAELACLEKPAVEDTPANGPAFSFAIKNNIGYPVNFTGLASSSGDCTVNAVNLSDSDGNENEIMNGGSMIIPNEETAIFWINCSEASWSKGKMVSQLNINYRTQAGLTKSAYYKITGDTQ